MQAYELNDLQPESFWTGDREDKKILQLSRARADDFYWIAASANNRLGGLRDVFGVKYMRAVPYLDSRLPAPGRGKSHIIVRPAAAVLMCRSIVAEIGSLELFGEDRRRAIVAATVNYLERLTVETRRAVPDDSS